MNSEPYEVAIIGGGIVGLAAAMRILERHPVRLVILEAESAVAQHQTGHNSGVIHAGLYYKPGSLKAKNCAEGREQLYRYCAEHGVAYERCGKLVVAADASQVPALHELERRGTANGLDGIRRLDASALREYEPNVAGVAGLHVPQTGIVDFGDVAKSYASVVQERGGEIRTRFALRSVERQNGELVLASTEGEVHARNLINCGGLRSDRIARMCGCAPGLQIIPFRGEYYVLTPEKSPLVRNLIYPVPDPRFPFLGVHFTRTVQGRVEAGPNAVLAFAREGYHRTSFSWNDTWDMLCYAGFWRMAVANGRMGLGEMWRSFNKAAFVWALQQLLPVLQRDDLVPGGAGVRAQAVEPDGKLVDDFRIIEADRMIHVLNAPSPAATASLSIGDTIAGMAEKNFGLD